MMLAHNTIGSTWLEPLAHIHYIKDPRVEPVSRRYHPEIRRESLHLVWRNTCLGFYLWLWVLSIHLVLVETAGCRSLNIMLTYLYIVLCDAILNLFLLVFNNYGIRAPLYDT